MDYTEIALSIAIDTLRAEYKKLSDAGQTKIATTLWELKERITEIHQRINPDHYSQ